MAVFGAYETIEELERTPFSVVFKATQANGKTRSVFVVKTIDLDASALDQHSLYTKNEQFLAAVRIQQKISDRSGTCHWAPVHDLGTVRGCAFYVTDLYPRTVAGMMKGRVKVSSRALYSLVRGIVRALKQLNQYCRRPHGNLKPSNILVADPDLDPTEIYLSDPLADELLPHDAADAGDMKALGRLIYQLVTHRPLPEVGGWPVQLTPEWQRLGRRGKDWVAFCNRLLDPLAEKPMTLDEASAALQKLQIRTLISPKLLITAAVAACLAGGVFATYKFIQRGGMANQVNAQAQPAAETRAAVDPQALAVAQLKKEIDSYLLEIQNRFPALEASRDALLARFPSLLQGATSENAAETKQRLVALDTLSKDLVAAVEKEYPTVDRIYFNQTAPIHLETKSKTTLTPDDFTRWLKEIKDPQYARLDEKLDPRKSWQPFPILRDTTLRIGELKQMAQPTAERFQSEADSLTAAIRQTRERRWNNAQKPLIEQEIKSLDMRIAKLSADVIAAIEGIRTNDARLAQLRAKLAANSVILSDDSLQAQWDRARQQIVDDLKKDPTKVEDLSKKTTDLQTRLTKLDQGLSESSRLAQQNDYLTAIDKLDVLIASYPDETSLRNRRTSFASPLHDRGLKYLSGNGVAADPNEAFKCLLLSAGLGDARAARMLGRIDSKTGASSPDSPKLLALFRRSADSGDAAAMNIVGLMYENGWGTVHDPKYALEWYTKSANAGFGGAMNNLGFLYYSGRGVKQDFQQALHWFTKGAEAGYPAAIRNVGTIYQMGHGVAVNIPEAAKWFLKAAEANDVSAMTRLAILYEEGQGIEQNFDEAAKWYRKAAEAGEPRAMLGLATLLENGLGLPRSDTDAFSWYSKAAAAGESAAIGRLASMHEEGRGTAKDEAKAFQLYTQAATAGDPQAMTALGILHESGRGTAKSDAEAIKWYSKAAEQNEPAALRNLAIMHAEGRGAAKDPKKAADFMKRSADAGDPLAMKDMAMSYLRGEGVEKNDAEAAKWMAKAAETGDPAAQSNLGVMYLNGQGVAKDEKKALELFRKSAEAGNAGAMANLGVMYKNGRGVAKDLYEAFEWYRKAAEAKDTLAMNNLGLMYQKGEGTKRDYNQAFTWFKAAADAGDSAAMNNLGTMYEMGQGVARNPAEAAKWFKMAADAGEATARRNLARVQRSTPTNSPPVRRDRISRDQ